LPEETVFYYAMPGKFGRKVIIVSGYHLAMGDTDGKHLLRGNG